MMDINVPWDAFLNEMGFGLALLGGTLLAVAIVTLCAAFVSGSLAQMHVPAGQR